MHESYIGIGDSISIDSYPALDNGLDIKSKVGAASRFGAWLVSEGHVDQQFNLAMDGATIPQIMRQLRLIPSEVRHLVNIMTVTAGGNDISFGAMRYRETQKDEFAYPILMERVKDEYKELCRTIREKFPQTYVIVNTLYDPTDGTGLLPNCGLWTPIADWYSRGRRELGEYIKTRDALPDENFLVADVFKLFNGHGMAEKNWGKRWYYSDFMIEPGYTGAIEVARLWRSTLKRGARFEKYEQLSFTN